MEQLELDVDNLQDMSEKELLVEAVKLLRELSQKRLPDDDRMWRVEHIALYVDTSVANAKRIMRNPKAPRGRRIPADGDTTTRPRYYPEQVREYIDKIGRKPSRKR